MRLALCCAAIKALLVAYPVAGYVNDKGFDVIRTVTLPNGQVIDWVRKESQGEIASPPPSLPSAKAPKVAVQHAFDETARGPDGTVPILRDSGIRMNKMLPPSSPEKSSRIYRRQNKDKHWYANSAQVVDNYGSSASMSMFKPYVQSDTDFSLLQTAVFRGPVDGVH